MHHGEYIGSTAESQSIRILILGESHHVGKNDTTPGVPAGYSTCSVVKGDYLGNRAFKGREFFNRITRSFGVDPNNHKERGEFWDKVYFGNYIDVLCGIGDSIAKKTIANGNRERYNNELFRFVNDNHVDRIFCFSRLVYNNLPSSSKAKRRDEDFGSIPVGGKSDYIALCRYMPMLPHNHTDIPLERELYVYGMRHPSAKSGFHDANYSKYLPLEMTGAGTLFKR